MRHPLVNTVRFEGGPADGEIRAVQAVQRYYYAVVTLDLPPEYFSQMSDEELVRPVPVLKHTYRVEPTDKKNEFVAYYEGHN